MYDFFVLESLGLLSCSSLGLLSLIFFVGWLRVVTLLFGMAFGGTSCYLISLSYLLSF